jgi:hypothetical protein
MAIDAEAGAPLLHGSSSFDLKATFSTSLAALLAALLGLLAVFGQFSEEATPAHVDRYYSFLTDVLVMVRAAWMRLSAPTPSPPPQKTGRTQQWSPDLP